MKDFIEQSIEEFRKEYLINTGRKWILTEDECAVMEDFLKQKLEQQKEELEKRHNVEMAVMMSSADQKEVMVRAEIKKKCEGMKNQLFKNVNTPRREGYNQALQDVIDNLK